MAGNFGDSTVATATNPAATADQENLSQRVQSLAVDRPQAASTTAADLKAINSLAPLRPGTNNHFAPQAPGRPLDPAAPVSDLERFADITVAGIKDIPRGVVNTLHNGLGLAENAGLSVGLGVAAKLVLPETGVAGKLFAIGLGAYFAEQTAVPVYKAYKNGMNARTMSGVNGAGDQLGDALGGLAVNIPIGILGYKLGSGMAGLTGRGGAGTAESGKGSGEKTGSSATSAKTSDAISDAKTGQIEAKGGPLSGRVEVTEKPDRVAEVDPAAGKGPALPDRYQPIKEDFSGTTVTGISRQFLNNLQVDNEGQYYGAGARYPDIMADPDMAKYVDGHNQVTMSAIDKAVYDRELANEAKASSYTLPSDYNVKGPAPTHMIDVTDGGEGTMSVGSKTYKLTDEGAPNRKLVVSDAFHPGKATTLISEPKDFEIQQVIQVPANGKGQFALVGSKDGASVLHLYDDAGKPTGEVTLPGYGTLHDVKQGASPSQIQFQYDTPIDAPRVVTVDMTTGKASFSAAQTQAFNSSDYVSEKLIVPYTDVDGNPQTVPAIVSRPKAMATDGKSLSYFKVYGGFDVGPQYVGYSPSTASWLMNGGVAVDPVLPGDGGLGSGNYQEGLGKGIENTDLALTAIIQKLHDLGYTSPETTGIYGRSNGGMVVNNMLNKRPTMIGAAVSESGVNSLFDSPVINPDTGQYWTPEFGDPQDPNQVGWMSRLDPINNLNAEQKLPPTMIAIGTKDGVVNVGNGITYHELRRSLNNGESVLYSRIGEGHDPVNLNLALQTAFLWDRLSKPKS
jgi:hypothetical protein